jgi:hypothetical protein
MKLSNGSSMDIGAAVALGIFSSARAMFPPSAVMHLGAGSGQGPLHQWRNWNDVTTSLVVDAQVKRLTWTKPWLDEGVGRLVSNATVSAVDGQSAEFLHVSNPDESGLIDLATLHSLWPQLRKLESITCQTRSLDSLFIEFFESNFLDGKNFWLLVDFFCSSEFWTSGVNALAHARVVFLRQSIKELEGIEPFQVTVKRMSELGFVQCATLESNHPDVVHAVYQRGYDKDLAALKSGLADVTLQLDAQSQAKQHVLAQLNQELSAKDEALAQRDEESKAKEEALAQRETLAQENANLQAALEVQSKAKDEALAQRDEESKAREEALAQRETLAQENANLQAALEALQRAKDQALAQRNQESKAKDQAISQREALAKEKSELLKSLEAHLKAKEEARMHIETLAQENINLLTSRDIEGKARDELQSQLEAECKARLLLLEEKASLERECASISSEKEAEVKRKKELLSQRDILVHEKLNLAAAREIEIQAKIEAQAERDGQVKIIFEQSGEIERLRAEISVLQANLDDVQIRLSASDNRNQGLYQRQDLLQDEMTKAEAQIDLIKDLLLREPRL